MSRKKEVCLYARTPEPARYLYTHGIQQVRKSVYPLEEKEQYYRVPHDTGDIGNRASGKWVKRLYSN
jgi:hypothetical protein